MYTIHFPFEKTTSNNYNNNYMFVAIMFTVNNVLSIKVLKECINHLMKMTEVSEFTHNTFTYCDFNFYSTVDTW